MLIIYLIHCVFVYGAQHGVCLLPVAQQLQSKSGVTHLIATVLEQYKRGEIHGIELNKPSLQIEHIPHADADKSAAQQVKK